MAFTKKKILPLALCIAMAATCLNFGMSAFASAALNTVTFDANGGAGAAPAQMQVLAGVPLGAALPGGASMTRAGYEFQGWYMKARDGSYGSSAANETHPLANPGTILPGDTTLYAAWQAVPKFVNIPAGTTSTALAVTLGITAASKLLDRDGAPIADNTPYIDGSYAASTTTATYLPIYKDLNGNGQLDPYENWALPVSARVEDLVSRLAADPDGVKKMAGLMLYSSHQSVQDPYISDAQLKFLNADHLRHVLVARVGNPIDAARWSNNVQALLEGISADYGIPANNSSDPRHGAASFMSAEYATTSNAISIWPSSLGMAATFDPGAMLSFGKIASAEYRLMGIATALSPQIDIATDPRWRRFNGTFGEDPKLAADMAAAYVRGFQSSYELRGDGSFGAEPSAGWGPYSVNAMIKHWPGGGSGEGGQDAHYAYGKYAVYPGGNFNAHLIPFVDGAFGPGVGPTGKATAVMPYYTISYLQVPGAEPNSSDSAAAKLNMANAYSSYMIRDLLRGAYKFGGVVCTDWNVIGPAASPSESSFGPTPGMIWGVDDHFPQIAGYTRADRQGRANLLLRAGVNQFGGLNSIEPIVDAYEANRAEIATFMLSSAKALLTNIFAPGLFENPYVDIVQAESAIGSAPFVQEGYQAQLDSMVLLKNKGGVLPLASGAKVYVPGAAQGRTNPKTVDDATLALIKKKFGEANVITDTSLSGSADAVLVFGTSLLSGGGSVDANGLITFKPAVLDYKPYTARGARPTSVAGAPIRDSAGKVIGRANNSYRDKLASPYDPLPAFIGTTPSTLQHFQEDINLAKASRKPIVLSLSLANPMVLEDIEPSAAAVLVDFESQKAAVLDMISGRTANRAGGGSGGAATVPVAPKGRLPMQMPKNMDAVEAQLEDVPRDMTPYRDTEGNTWDFGFGLTYGAGAAAKLPAPGAYSALPLTAPSNADGAAAIAERVNVGFDYDGDGKADFIKVVKRGTPVTDIVDPLPAKSGYRQSGWLNGSAIYDFRQNVTAPLTLKANWLPLSSGGGGGSSSRPPISPSAPSAGTDSKPAAPGGDKPTGGSQGGGARPASNPLGRFTDAASVSAWARPYVTRLVEAGVLTGRPGGALDPKGYVTRAEFAKMTVDYLGVESSGAPKSFSDVKQGDWHKSYVDVASSSGIVRGVSDTLFEPDSRIMRQDVCVMLHRALAYLGAALPDAKSQDFADSAKISGYARDAVAIMRQIGVVSGRSDGRFDPSAYATREETAKMLCGALDALDGY